MIREIQELIGLPNTSAEMTTYGNGAGCWHSWRLIYRGQTLAWVVGNVGDGPATVGAVSGLPNDMAIGDRLRRLYRAIFGDSCVVSVQYGYEGHTWIVWPMDRDPHYASDSVMLPNSLSVKDLPVN